MTSWWNRWIGNSQPSLVALPSRHITTEVTYSAVSLLDLLVAHGCWLVDLKWSDNIVWQSKTSAFNQESHL